ncbi:branched-chain amino acid ABC transporter permease [Phytoactinopolyspora mesophila]|uniref:Branched-chain amino acid ABC transporter permease n=1 Tax=Phytoactinopolyspora mesophila TaxID=2650750 RepID=A0A7K3M711_9ACTN|nr:branched-chain amino acid ABC transporter permease [Phytoactinopolyspora mesophila]NDL59113.1 branched-chain amino acid ABC transporter permease [Phytoactinopolyspora mesophila]
MSEFLQLTLFGLSNGAILALAALGFVLIYKATGVINFAQGHFLLIGAYVFYAAMVVFGFHWTLSILFGVVIAIALGVVVERFVLRPMIGEEAIAVIMVTIGLSSMFAGGVQFMFGTSPKETPRFLPPGSMELAGATVPWSRIAAIAIAAVVLTAFTLFFTRSRHGIAMRAVADDQQAALTIGISVRRVFALAWALAAATAVIGGILLANLTGVSPALAGFGLVVFPVVILGGLDSVPGTIAGGIIIGLLVQYTAGYVGGGLEQVIPFIVLIGILMVRPYGLFGQVRIERV